MNEDIDNKIILALERLGQASKIASWQKSRGNGLNPAQLQALNFLSTQRQERRTISCMARAFGLSKASLSETILALQKKGLLKKDNASFDYRIRILTLTSQGKTAVETRPYQDDLRQYFYARVQQEKQLIFASLLGLLQFLNKKGFIPSQGMCYTCTQFNHEKSFCNLLKRKLNTQQLQINCQDHSIQ